MTTLRQSFAWWAFSNDATEPAALLESARATGYEAVELIPVELWETARRAGLTIAAHGAHEGIVRGFTESSYRDQGIEEIRRAIDLAQANGVPNLIVFSGSKIEGQSESDGIGLIAEGLSRVAGEAQAAGVTLILEVLNSRVDHPGYFADRTEIAARVCESVRSPALKILYDIYHMQIMEGDLIRTIASHIDRIGHIHTAGNPGRVQIDDAQEINYPPIFRAIAETDYSGYVCHEFVPRGDAVAELRRAFEITKMATSGGAASASIR